MNRLEKTLGTIFVAGLITLGAGLYKNNNVIKGAGAAVAALSGVTFFGYQCDKYEKRIKRAKKFEGGYYNRLNEKVNNHKLYI